ncbi:FkbM family methyltransferase [Gammaproteobacteria bacterium]|nr:FkbM family methyltransferase [Gammaproteobacteria bacterium]
MRLIHRFKFFVGSFLKRHPFLFQFAWLTLRKIGRSLPHDKSYFGFKYLANESNGLFLDIGANNGLSALSFNHIQPNYKIFSVEISHYNRRDLDKLKQNIETFDYKIVGVSDQPGEYTLYTPVYWGIAITLLSSLDLKWLKAEVNRTFLSKYISKISYKEQLVQVVILDELCFELNLAPSIVKIDAEGSDMKILKSMEQTVELHRPYIMVEYSPLQLETLLSFCQKFGYNLFLFNDTLSYFEEFVGHKALKQYQRGDFAVNPFCIPKEKISLLPRSTDQSSST